MSYVSGGEDTLIVIMLYRSLHQVCNLGNIYATNRYLFIADTLNAVSMFNSSLSPWAGIDVKQVQTNIKCQISLWKSLKSVKYSLSLKVQVLMNSVG